MKKTKVILSLILALSMFSLVSETYGSDSGGSVNDPLVTKSYVDELFASISENPANQISDDLSEKLTLIEGEISKLSEKVEKLEEDAEHANDESGNSNFSDSSISKDDFDSLKVNVSELTKELNDLKDKKLDSSSGKLDKRVEDLEKSIEKIGKELEIDFSKKINKDNFINSEVYVAIEAKKGQKVVLGSGAEIILRAGKAIVVAGVNGDGLADITVGHDLRQGDEAPAQHLLLSSRNDGRALKITSEGTAYLLVKGDYKIE